jgi:hypothetical protein
MVVLWGLALLVGMAGVALAQTAPAGDLADCLRDNPDRYADPGAAVDDQYAGPVDACRALIEGDGVQVTVTPSGDSEGPGGGSPPASSGSASSSGDGSSRAGTSAGPATGAGTPSTTTTRTNGDRVAPGAPAADEEGPSSSRRTVERAIARADAAGGLGGPSSATDAPAWILALGGALLAAIAGGAAFRVYRRGR